VSPVFTVGLLVLSMVAPPELLHVTWRCLRTSHATWLVQAGADPKSVQGQMRHSRISTTMDIYAQIVPVAQRQAIEKLSDFACHTRVTQNGPLQ
jgi:integrase